MQTLRMVAENILVTPLMIALSHVFITWVARGVRTYRLFVVKPHAIDASIDAPHRSAAS